MVLIDIKTDEEFHFYKVNYPQLIVMMTADYCSRCKIMEPIYRHKAEKYPRKNFLVVDCKKIVKHGIDLQAMPTFLKYKNGLVIESFSGDDCLKLEEMLNNHIESKIPTNTKLANREIKAHTEKD